MKAESNESTASRVALPCCAAALLASALLAGCTSLPEMPWAPVARDASAGFYQTARLEYRLDAGKLGQPLDIIRVQGRQVNYEQIASSPLPEQSTGTLVIQYPHPLGKPELARVTFSIDSGSTAGPEKSSLNPFKSGEPSQITPANEEVHEVWALDLPRSESDRFFKLLSTQNFYAGGTNETGSAELTVTIDGKQIRKPWDQLPDLNALASRVRREGQLVGYFRPAALAGSGANLIASTAAYRALLAEAGTSTGTQGPGSSGAQGRESVARLPYAAR